jgi:hypothetical protein
VYGLGPARCKRHRHQCDVAVTDAGVNVISLEDWSQLDLEDELTA